MLSFKKIKKVRAFVFIPFYHQAFEGRREMRPEMFSERGGRGAFLRRFCRLGKNKVTVDLKSASRRSSKPLNP